MADRENWLCVSFLGAGWLRHLPDRALLIVNAVAAGGPMPLDVVERGLAGIRGLELGWRAPAWEPPYPWTDAELDDLRQESESADVGVAPSAAELIAQEAAARGRRVTELEAHAARLGVPAPTTLGTTLDFLLACGVLASAPGADHRAGAAMVALAADPPMPAQVLQLSREEAALEERMRRARAQHRSRPQPAMRPTLSR